MPTVHHIPACPFSQRLEILLALRGCADAVRFEVVDITRPRSPALLARADGNSALPLLVADDGTVLRESLVILRYLDALLPGTPLADPDPLRHAVENLLCSHEGAFGNAGYALLMNRDPARRDALCDALVEQYARLDRLLCRHAGPTWLGQYFGWAETVFAPLFVRLQFLAYYEDFTLPATPQLARVGAWQQACLQHPAAQQLCREAVVKLYFDYGQGAGNGALPPGRQRSSFAFDPHWRDRPWPPRDKYGAAASDAQLGLV